MIYRFNNQSLEFEKVNLKKWIIIGLFVFLSTGFGASKIEKVFIEGEKEIILRTENEFSKEAFIEEIKKYNFNYPDIIYAQACLESQHFKSPVFKNNSNLFGLKQAQLRVTTSKGTELNHAVYNNWKESLQDRVIYEASYLRKITTKEEYLQFLGQNYAEDKEYVSKIKNIINNSNIKF